MDQKLRIPSDWDGESWAFAICCIPDSLMWRGVFSGTVYRLTRGRTWDPDTGRITEAQKTARLIFEGLNMDCFQLIERMTVAAESMAESMASIDNKTPDLITIQDALEYLTTNQDNIADRIIDFKVILGFLGDLIPGLPRISMPDLVGMYTQWRFNSAVLAHLKTLADSNQALALSTGGPLLTNVTQNLSGIADKSFWMSLKGFLPEQIEGIVPDHVTDARELWNIFMILEMFLGGNSVVQQQKITNDLLSTLKGDLTLDDFLASLDGIESELANIEDLKTLLGEKLGEIKTALGNINPNAELKNVVTKLDAINPNAELKNVVTELGEIKAGLATAMIDANAIPYLERLSNLEHLIQLQHINATLKQITQEIAALDDKPSVGVGEGEPPPTYPSWPAYNAYKCKIANGIYDFVYQTCVAFKLNDVDEISQLGITSSAAMIAGVLAALGPVGWVTGLAGVAITAVVTFIASGILIDFDDLSAILEINKSAIIQAMYDAKSTAEARSGFIRNMKNASPAESGMVELLLQNRFLNVLFGNHPVPDGYQPSVECGTCGQLDLNRGTDLTGGFIINGELVNGTFEIEASPNPDPDNNQVVVFYHNFIDKQFNVWLSWQGGTPSNNNITLLPLNCVAPPSNEYQGPAPTSQEAAINFTGTGMSLIIDASGANYPAHVFIEVLTNV